jgi:predicted lipase
LVDNTPTSCYDNPTYQIVFTGLSLGGSLAALAAVDFNDVAGLSDRISLYTYGQPRVGNKAFVEYVNSLPFASRIVRVVRNGDPVPRLPLAFMGYSNFKQQYSLDDNGNYVKCEDT